MPSQHLEIDEYFLRKGMEGFSFRIAFETHFRELYKDQKVKNLNQLMEFVFVKKYVGREIL